MEDRTYTLSEARTLFEREECARANHRPVTEIATLDEPVSRWYCDCSSYLYAPTSTSRPQR